MYYFIVNPASCSGNGRIIWKKIKQELIRRNIPCRYFFTQKPGDASKIAASLFSVSSCSDSTVVAVGGDGTANEVLNGLSNTESITFGYIPTGSSNDLARSLGIPSDPLLALCCILNPKKTVLMDIGMVFDRSHKKKFAVSAGIGFDAGICHEAFTSPIKPVLNRIHLGKLTYAAIAVHQLFVSKLTPMELILDGKKKVCFQKVYMAAIMNHPCEGGGIFFCPDASYEDGFLDLCIIEGISRLRAIFILLKTFSKTHIRSSHVHIFRCKTATIHTKYRLPVHMDGEIFGKCRQISAKAAKCKIRVITG